MCSISGRLELDEEKRARFPALPEEACVIVHPGIQQDGWWESKDLYNQLHDRAIPIFEA